MKKVLKTRDMMVLLKTTDSAQFEAIHTIKLQLQQTLKPYTLTWLLTHCFVLNYFRVWDRRQLNPTYTHRISSYQHLGLDLRLITKNYFDC